MDDDIRDRTSVRFERSKQKRPVELKLHIVAVAPVAMLMALRTRAGILAIRHRLRTIRFEFHRA
jgi:hypothetical protein